MSHRSDSNQQSAFSRWLRSGRLPVVRTAGKLELKFNPWHDLENGRFTFAGSGQCHGGGGSLDDRGPQPVSRSNPPVPAVTAVQNRDGPRLRQTSKLRRRSDGGSAVSVTAKRIATPNLAARPSPAGEFVGGVGEGLYGVAKGTVEAVHSALTTNPATTARDVGRGVARAIDTMVAAEDTPAAIQVSRAVGSVANASAREIGRATGSVIGNTAVFVAPGAALGKVSALRQFRNAVPRPTYEPPKVGWVREKLTSDKPWRAYNDAAPGSRPGQAPTLMRTMPDSSRRPVKFDGVEGDYMIDRKWSIRDAPHARAQLLRQSEVLAQHRSIGTWEVPNERERIAAHKLLRKMGVTNIKVRVVKP